MIVRVVDFCTRHSWAVIAVALLLAAGGELARRSLSADVIPDLADPQIVLVADWMGHPATEVASAVTRVLTTALEGVPGSTTVRGSSMSGMAYVTVLFDSASALAHGREAIMSRIAKCRQSLPSNLRIRVGPLASSTGWVFQYAVIDRSHAHNLLTLRALQDDVLQPHLSALPGVAEVASVGGDAQQLSIDLSTDALRERNLAYSDVLSALRDTFRTLRQADPKALASMSVAAAGGRHFTLGDVAQIRVAHAMPSGIADLGGAAGAVGGIVIARRDADLSRLIESVKRALDRERSRLPSGVELVTVYDRSELTARVGRTLASALTEEIAVVVLVIVVFLLHARSALVPLVTLPLVVLLTLAGMWIAGVSASIMSLGGIGIALGMAVDADVVALEACHRRLETLGSELSALQRRAELTAAAASFTPAILTSLSIAALSFLPVFAFSGETGRLLRPLALTKTLVIAAAAFTALTLAPAMRDRLLRSGSVGRELDNPLTRGLVRLYRPFVHFALSRPTLTLATAFLAVISSLPLLPRLGGEFLPRIDEGDLLFMPTTRPNPNGDDAAVQLRRQDAALQTFAQVESVFGKIGRADTATDPAPYSMVETTIRLRARSEWPTLARTRWYSAWAPAFLRAVLVPLWPEQMTPTTSELIEQLDRATQLPGWSNAWTAPARARLDMMSTGVRTPVGIRIVAADAARLDTLARAVRRVALRQHGTRSAVIEAASGETWLGFDLDRAALARQRVDPVLAQATVDFALSGAQLGEAELGGRRLRVHLLTDANARGPADLIRTLTVRATAEAADQPVPLALLGRPSFLDRPAVVRSERGATVAYVYVDLAADRDVLGYVAATRRALDHMLATHEIRLERGERIEWTGQYELMMAGRQRLLWIIPLVALSMIGLLALQFRSLAEALIVLVSVPFALVGSIWMLYLAHYALSAPVWVGLLSVVGLAMQTGVVMVLYIDAAFYRRLRDGQIRDRDDIVAAHAEGTVARLRPKLMTIATMAAGLLPFLWSDGAGAEIMKRVAVPMLGGLVTSALLTLEVLPVLYTMWRFRQLKQAARLGLPLEAVVGSMPAWARETGNKPRS